VVNELGKECGATTLADWPSYPTQHDAASICLFATCYFRKIGVLKKKKKKGGTLNCFAVTMRG